jgi:hypothetical protein
VHQLIHQLIVAATEQRSALPFLPDQALLDQLGNVVGKGGGGNIQLVLDLSHGHPGCPGLNQQTVDTEPMGAAQGF